MPRKPILKNPEPLTAAIIADMAPGEFVVNYNRHPAPFMWTASADSILEKIERLSKVINGTRH